MAIMNGLTVGAAVGARIRHTIGQAQEQSARGAISEVGIKTENLAMDVDKLFMITQALWELLKEEHGYTDETLIKKIAENGKVTKKERLHCPSCGRKMGRHPTCLYCGAAAPERCPFER